ncbi:hypothetical protein [Heyndrickxia coagulans]|uniref:hypothetical protein n=1 Tax=Heyndrickxia coagulans TaxID=1398 RepID=UPI001C533C09|nr:hypothetical protein [Heyndrickxia coagulans]
MAENESPVTRQKSKVNRNVQTLFLSMLSKQKNRNMKILLRLVWKEKRIFINIKYWKNRWRFLFKEVPNVVK